MELTQKAKKILLKESNKILLCQHTGKSYSTIHRWLKNNDEKLTIKSVIEVIKEITGLEEEQIFTSKKSKIEKVSA